jgi:hypothetical protein
MVKMAAASSELYIVAHAIHGSIAKLHLTYWKMALENVSGIFQDGKT